MKQSHCPCGAPNANVDFDSAQAALEAAQADARRYRALHEAISDNYYCHKCDVAPASQIKNALAAIDANLKEKP